MQSRERVWKKKAQITKLFFELQIQRPAPINKASALSREGAQENTGQSKRSKERTAELFLAQK